MSYEYESRLNRIVNFAFDKRYVQNRFKSNNIEFYSALSNDECGLLEYRYEAVLHDNWNTSIVLVIKTTNEPMKQMSLFSYLD